MDYCGDLRNKVKPLVVMKLYDSFTKILLSITNEILQPERATFWAKKVEEYFKFQLPQKNGLVERFLGFIGNMIAKYARTNRQDEVDIWISVYLRYE